MSKSLRHNAGKVALSKVLLFRRGLESIVAVMKQGEIKYPDVSETGKPNWMAGGKPNEEYADAIVRHCADFVAGDLYDEELGTQVVAHIAWNALAYLTLNCEGLDLINPEHDQEAFVEKWRKFYEEASNG